MVLNVNVYLSPEILNKTTDFSLYFSSFSFYPYISLTSFTPEHEHVSRYSICILSRSDISVTVLAIAIIKILFSLCFFPLNDL